MLYADASDAIGELNEQNNYFYTTNQYPALFQGGVAKNGGGGYSDHKFENPISPGGNSIKDSEFNSAVSKENPNAYSVAEIKQMISRDKKSGRFDQKLQAFISSRAESRIEKGNR